MKIIAVDDDEMLLSLYSHHFKNWPLSVECTCFTNGYQALEHVATHSADLLIVDWQMPVISGRELIMSLYQAFDMRSTKVVVVSGADIAQIRLDAALNDTVEVLPKPVPFDQLLAIAMDWVIANPRAT